MDNVVSSEHPIVQAMGAAISWGAGAGFITSFGHIASFVYILIWALDRWGLYDIGLDDELIFLEWVRWPIQQLEKFVALK